MLGESKSYFADRICMVLTEWYCLKQNMACYVVFHVLHLMEDRQYTHFFFTRHLKTSKTFDVRTLSVEHVLTPELPFF